MANGNEFKLGGNNGNSVDLAKLKSGVNRSAFESDAKMLKVFDAIDTNSNQTIDLDEVTVFTEGLKNAANGDDTITKDEAQQIFKSQQEQARAAGEDAKKYDLKSKHIFGFIEQFLNASETSNVKSSVVDENGNQTLTYEDESQEIINKDGSKILSQVVNGKKVSKHFDKDGNLVKESEADEDGETSVSYDPITKKPVQKTITKGSKTEVYDYTSDTNVRLSKVVSKNEDDSEQVSEFGYDEQGNIISKTVNTTMANGNTSLVQYELNENAGTLLPKQEIINKGTENELVTKFEVADGGYSMVSETETPRGLLKVNYTISDEIDANGVASYSKTQEILTTDDGYESVEYKDDSIVYTQKTAEGTRTETKYKDGRNTIEITTDSSYVHQTINSDGSVERSIKNNDNSSLIEKYDANQKLIFKQETDADNNVTKIETKGNNTVLTKIDKDNNIVKITYDESGRVVSQQQALGPKAKAEQKRQQIVQQSIELGVDPASVRRYNSNNNKITVKAEMPSTGKVTGKGQFTYQDPANSQRTKTFTYEERENYIAHPKFNADGEIDGVTYEPKRINVSGRIIGDVKGVKDTVVVYCSSQNKLYYVDKKTGLPRSEKLVRGDIAFNNAKKEDFVDAARVNAAVYTAASGIEVSEQRDDLVILRDSHNKPMKTKDGHGIAVDKYGNRYILHDDSAVYQTKDKKPLAVFAEGRRGQEIYAKYLNAEDIATNPKAARETTLAMLEGLSHEIEDADSDLQKYLSEDGQSWDHRFVDWFCDAFGSDNNRDDIDNRLKTAKANFAELRKLAESGDEAGFRTKYKEITGKTYDPKSIALFYANQNEQTRKSVLGDDNYTQLVNDYVSSQYSSVAYAEGGVVTAVAIGSGLLSDGALTPVVITGAASLGLGVMHNATTGKDVNWKLIGDDHRSLGDLGKLVVTSAIDGITAYGGAKGYKMVADRLAKPISESFMRRTGTKLLEDTTTKLGKLGLGKERNLEQVLKELSKKDLKLLSPAEQALVKEQMSTIIQYQTLTNIVKKPTVEGLQKLSKLGLLKDADLVEAMKDIPLDTLKANMMIDVGAGAVNEFAKTGEVTTDGLIMSATTSFLMNRATVDIPKIVQKVKTPAKKSPEIPPNSRPNPVTERGREVVHRLDPNNTMFSRPFAEGLENVVTESHAILEANKKVGKHALAGLGTDGSKVVRHGVYNDHPQVKKMKLEGDAELTQDAQKIAMSAYGEGAVDSYHGWQEIASVDGLAKPGQHGTNGFHTKVFMKDDKIMIAFRGSDDVADLVSDFEMLQGKMPEQIENAVSIVQDIQRQHPDKKIIITGHSLGGALTELTASRFDNVLGISFDAVGTKPLIEASGGKYLDHNNTINYIIKGDEISNATQHPGYTVVMDGNSRFTEHAGQNFGRGAVSKVDATTPEMIESLDIDNLLHIKHDGMTEEQVLNSLATAKSGVTIMNEADLFSAMSPKAEWGNPHKHTLTVAEQFEFGHLGTPTVSEIGTQNIVPVSVNQARLNNAMTTIGKPVDPRVLASRNYDVSGSYSTVRTVSGEETNRWWKLNMDYDNPPYLPNKDAHIVVLDKETTFVRTFDVDGSGPYGGWVMQKKDLLNPDGTMMTPAQIQDKFALPQKPLFMCDVTLPKGSILRTGECNPLEGWGKGGGTQFDLMGQKIGRNDNPVCLPGVGEEIDIAKAVDAERKRLLEQGIAVSF